MKLAFLSILSLLVGLLAQPHTAWSAANGVHKSAYKSYREWKQDKVSEAQNRLDSIKSRIHQGKQDPNLSKSGHSNPEGSYTNIEATRLERQMISEQNKLETARELTVSDYFAGYLAKLADRPSAFKDVAGRLSAEEVAELMSAYANSVFGSQSGAMGTARSDSGLDPLK